MNNIEETMNDIEVSVVMPCLNEEETIGTCVNKAFRTLAGMGCTGEVIVSDNGSTDRSIEIAKSLGARVVFQNKKGYGNAYLKGFEAVRGKYVVMGDSDDSYDFTDLERFVEPLRNGYDMVMGTRIKGDIMPGAMPWLHRYVGNPFLSGFLNMLFHTGISDAHCGMRSFTREALEKMCLKTAGMEFASEMVINASKAGLKIKEIPITLHKDGRTRKPHLKSFRDGWRHLRFMMLYSPEFLFLVPAVSFFLAGMLTVLWIFFGESRVGNVNLGLNTMTMGCFSIFLGMQAFMSNVMVKLYYCQKNPLFQLDRISRKIRDKITFDRGIIAGVILILIGVSFDFQVIMKWYGAGYRDLALESVKYALLGMTFMVIGVQIFFFTFMVSVIKDSEK